MAPWQPRDPEGNPGQQQSTPTLKPEPKTKKKYHSLDPFYTINY